jgi:hypothetical protein
MKTLFGIAMIFSAGFSAACVADGGVDKDDAPIRLAEAPTEVVPTAFRFVDLDLRDPHTSIRFLGCRDITDTPLLGFSVNGQIATSLGTDADGDGNLDFSPLVVFRPLDQSAATNPVDVLTGACTAAEPSSCSVGDATPTPLTATNTATGVCLGTLDGTTSGYTPAITTPTDNCFATDAGTLHLTLASIPVTLSNAQVAAVYDAVPATGMVNGLLRGFISETDANNTTLPPDLPLVGGKPLSSLLAGGTGNCASTSDKDTLDGVPGWWFYLNFTAQTTAWSE